MPRINRIGANPAKVLAAAVTAIGLRNQKFEIPVALLQLCLFVRKGYSGANGSCPHASGDQTNWQPNFSPS